jgi:maltose alpha-D-glucosyltransferase/alpha-amylase
VEISRQDVEETIRRLDLTDIAAARWFGGKGREIRSIGLGEAFVLPGDRHVLAVADVAYERGPTDAYLFPLIAEGEGLRIATDGDGALRALTVAIAEGRTIPSLPTASAATAADSTPGPVTAALVCRPALGLRDLEPDGAEAIERLPERPLGVDQSNSSVVLGDRLLLKAYRWLQPGLNPDLELVAFLNEEAGFTAVPPLAGYAEMVSRSRGPSTVAMLQGFVADGKDAYELVAEMVTGWLLAPGSVSVEYATEIAADVGTLTAGLHAALSSAGGVPEFEPRRATRDELRAWYADARQQLDRAMEIAPGDAGRVLRKLSPQIADALTVFEALPTEPIVTRVHGDYHLGHVLSAPDGYRIVDFEGEPTGDLEERRAHRSPLRDVASMLRSFDQVGRSAGRRAEERNGGPLASPGLDLDAWLRRSRERFLAAYRTGLREGGAPIEVDPDLLRAFEIERECHGFVDASTYLPERLWAPIEGMRALLETALDDAQRKVP